MESVRCRCSCCSSKSTPQDFEFDNREHRLSEIERSLEHKLTLKDWNVQLTASSNTLVRKLSSSNSSTSDLYQILGLFFVFEGVVITAVAHASAIKCHNSWLIFTLSTLVSVATLFACIQKLREIAKAKTSYLQERAFCSSLSNSIQELKEKGSAFDLVARQPKVRYTLQSSGFSDRIYAGAVFFFLVVFSGVTLAAVHLIVCDPLRN